MLYVTSHCVCKRNYFRNRQFKLLGKSEIRTNATHMNLFDIQFALTEYLLFLFVTSTIILSLVNYKLNKTLKRINTEAQYWCELYIKTNRETKDNQTEEYEDVI